jgi:hypothetical protein
MSAVPKIVITIPVEGKAVAYIHATSLEEARRLGHELQARDLTVEVLEALLELCEQMVRRAA